MNKGNPIRIASDLSGIPVEEIIASVGISENQIQELDKNPRSASMDLIEELESVSGLSVDCLIPKKKIAGPNITPTYESETADFISLIKQKRGNCEELLVRYEGIDDKEISAVLTEMLDTYNKTAQNALDRVKKPVVCAFGNSDTGKSTLINYFLGENVAKTSYSPLTSTVVYYEHIQDMPEYLKNEFGHNAFVFGEVNEEKRKRKTIFSHEDISNQRKAKKYLISSGKFNEIIDEYSSREGVNYKTKEYQIFEIVVYLDIDILKELSFIDIPGFGSGDAADDVGIARKMYSVDILFYLMVANAFMRGTDIAKLQMMLKQRKSLDGLFILSTQANVLGTPLENKKRLDSGYEILLGQLTEKQAAKFDSEELRRCFYAFDTRNEKYCKALNEAIETSVPRIIKYKIDSAKSDLEHVCDELNDKYKTERAKILEGRSHEKKNKEAEQLFVKDRKRELRIYRAELKNNVEEYRKASVSEFETAYEEFITESNLVMLMEKKGLKNKKEEVQHFSAYLSNEMGEQLSEILGKKSEAYAERVNEVLRKYEKSWNGGKKANKLGIDFEGFDFKRAFAAGLTGVGTYGALSVWATIVAGGSNLGAYILVAKVVSALSAIGISLGGTSTVAAAVSAIGGPATLGIALAVIAAVAVFGIFSGNWKNRLAKELIKTFKKQGYKSNNIKQINQHWDDTIVATEECLKSLEDSLLDYYHKMNAIQERIQDDDQDLYEALSYIYYSICNLYTDLKFKLTVDKERIGKDFFIERKKEIEAEIEKVKKLSTKFTLNANVHEMEGLVFLNENELQDFWKDLIDILNDKAKSLIELTDNTYLLKRDRRYSVYYKKIKRQISIRYFDAYPYLKDNYEKYKDLIINTYVLKDDQIRYKVFDMLTMAQKEVLMIMPWINSYGWDSVGSYGKSLKQIFENILAVNEKLTVRIMVGYDLQHPDADKERQTVEMAKQIQEEFSAYSDRFIIKTGIGSHEKIITIDNVCSLDGSYNLLSNDAPYQEKSWAGESMTTFENPFNIERHRREILERAKLTYKRFA